MKYVTPKLTMFFVVEQDVVRTSLEQTSESVTGDLTWESVGGKW